MHAHHLAWIGIPLFLLGSIWLVARYWSSTERLVPLEPSNGVIADIKKRGIYVLDRKGDNGGSVLCAEPSPDALTATAASIAASGEAGKKFASKLAASMSENAAYVGLRTQTIQLLRDGMYRLCEGYMNGALSKKEFRMRTRQYQTSMIARLAIEQLTGAISAPSVVVNATGELGGDTDLTKPIAMRDAKKISLTKREAAIAETRSRLAGLEEKDPNTAKERKKLLSEISDIASKIASDKADIAALEQQISGAGATTITPYAIVNVSPPTKGKDDATEDSIEAVTTMAYEMLTADHTTEMCF